MQGYTDVDLEMAELEDASRWHFCPDCGDEIRATKPICNECNARRSRQLDSQRHGVQALRGPGFANCAGFGGF